jgi:hypothetical protein
MVFRRFVGIEALAGCCAPMCVSFRIAIKLSSTSAADVSTLGQGHGGSELGDELTA